MTIQRIETMYRHFQNLFEIWPSKATARVLRTHCRAESVQQIGLRLQIEQNYKQGIPKPPATPFQQVPIAEQLAAARKKALEQINPNSKLYWVEPVNVSDPRLRCDGCVCA